jgi:hypothetical protein
VKDIQKLNLIFFNFPEYLEIFKIKIYGSGKSITSSTEFLERQGNQSQKIHRNKSDSETGATAIVLLQTLQSKDTPAQLL